MRAGVEQSTRRDVKCQHEHISLDAREFRFATCKINWQFLKLTFAPHLITLSAPPSVISSPLRGDFLSSHSRNKRPFVSQYFCTFNELEMVHETHWEISALLGSDVFPAVEIYKIWARREGNGFLFLFDSKCLCERHTNWNCETWRWFLGGEARKMLQITAKVPLHRGESIHSRGIGIRSDDRWLR